MPKFTARLASFLTFSAGHGAFLLLLLIYAFTQVWCRSHSGPALFPDSEYYLHLAGNLEHGDWSEFHTRTPGYPLFLYLAKAVTSPAALLEAVVTIQYFLGTAALALIYAFYRRLDFSSALATAAAGFSCFDLQSMMFRQLILTETLSYFLVSLILLLLIITPKRPAVLAIATGFLMFILVMVRPSFQLAGWAILAGGFITQWFSGKRWKELAPILIFAVTTQVLLFGWCLKIYNDTGTFTLSHGSGIVLMSHTSQFIDQAPDERFTPYKQAFQEALAEGSRPELAIFPAMKKVEEIKSEPPWVTADHYKELAKWVILRNPVAYLGQVGQGVGVMTAQSPSAYYDDSLLQKSIDQRPLLHSVDQFLKQQFWHRATRQWAVWGVALLGLVAVYRQADSRRRLGFTVMVIIALYNVAIHCAVNSGDLPRYRLPLQPWLLSFVPVAMFMIGKALVSLKGRSGSPA